MLCLYSLRYTYVFKIHARTYVKQVSGSAILRNAFFHDMANIRLQVYNFGVMGEYANNATCLTDFQMYLSVG